MRLSRPSNMRYGALTPFWRAPLAGPPHGIKVRGFHVPRSARAPQPVGPDRSRVDFRPFRPRGSWLARHGPAAALARYRSHHARLRLPALLRPAHDAAHVPGARRVAPLHADLCDPRGQEPSGRGGSDPVARRPAVSADPRLPVLHGHVLPEPVPGQRPRRRDGRHLRHLHEPGLEHGLFVLPVAAHGPVGSGRGFRRVFGCRPGRSSGSSRHPSRYRR